MILTEEKVGSLTAKLLCNYDFITHFATVINQTDDDNLVTWILAVKLDDGSPDANLLACLLVSTAKEVCVCQRSKGQTRKSGKSSENFQRLTIAQ